MEQTKNYHTAYAVVYRRSSPHMDGEMKKGEIHSLHKYRSVARLVRNPKWHVIKKITFAI